MGTGATTVLNEEKQNFKFTKTISANSNLQVNILKTADDTVEAFWSNIDNYRQYPREYMYTFHIMYPYEIGSTNTAGNRYVADMLGSPTHEF